MNQKNEKNLKVGVLVVVGVFLLLCVFEIYVPVFFGAESGMVFTITKGEGYSSIGWDLQKQGIIKNAWFFDGYVLISGNHGKLQAGSYRILPSMSVADIVEKFAVGDVIKNNITIIEGWDLQDIADYLQSKNIVTESEFLAAASAPAKNSAQPYPFLNDKPAKASLEGYIFPDTYNLPENATSQIIINLALANFDKKLTPALRQEIAKQHKTIFQIITMASILEKEVKTPADKKTVAGILWKRIAGGVPLDVDSTIDYITGKNNGAASATDKQINSPYNTYKFYGLPPGPICNPGMDSISAAIYPTQSNYWYYLSDPKTGQTIFSATLEQQAAAIAKYLKP